MYRFFTASTLLLFSLIYTSPAMGQMESVVLVRTESNSIGTGVLIDDQYVVTANHVVTGDSRIRVEIGNRIIAAVVAIRDVPYDLAILKLAESSRRPSMHLSSESLRRTDPVKMLGHAHGQWTITEKLGKVVGIQRRTDEMIDVLISTPVIYGMSGGPVINEAGQIAGIIIAVVIEDSKAVDTVSAPAEAVFNLARDFAGSKTLVAENGE